MEDGLASEACSEPVDLLAAVQSAAEELDSHDPYRQQLVSWLSDLASLDDGERPPKPPKLDTRKLGKVLEARRKAARAAALEYRQSLHEDWTASNAQRIAVIVQPCGTRLATGLTSEPHSPNARSSASGELP